MYIEKLLKFHGTSLCQSYSDYIDVCLNAIIIYLVTQNHIISNVYVRGDDFMSFRDKYSYFLTIYAKSTDFGDVKKFVGP